MTILKFYRPEILFPCFAQLISLSGIGPRTATIMEKRIGKYVIDLAFYDIDMNFCVEMGEFEFMVGGSSNNNELIIETLEINKRYQY